jgi:hypothetical protein
VAVVTLAFPNPSRSFDRTRNAVRFTGYDGMFEVPFFVEIGALVTSATELRMSDTLETTSLSAFDASRASIHAAAFKVYSGGRRTNYTLTAADLR